MKQWRRVFVIGLIIAISSQVYWNVFVNNFRISIAVILLPVLIMTVGPGFVGQGYIDACTDKIRAIRKAIDENGYQCELEIDGGAKLTNTPDIVAAGANVIVAGSAVFGGDIAGNVKGFKKIFDEFENNYFAF